DRRQQVLLDVGPHVVADVGRQRGDLAGRGGRDDAVVGDRVHVGRVAGGLGRRHALLPGVAGDLGEVDVDLVLGLVEGVDGGLVPLVLDVLEAQLPELDRGGALGGVV